LSILSVSVSSDGFTLYFLTNNPLVIAENSLPFANGRILVGSTIDPTVGSSIAIPQSILASVMPWLITTSDLDMSYSLSDP
jgi:hypothetical protein